MYLINIIQHEHRFMVYGTYVGAFSFRASGGFYYPIGNIIPTKLNRFSMLCISTKLLSKTTKFVSNTEYIELLKCYGDV